MDKSFRVTVEPGGIVRVAGELDIAVAEQLVAAVQALDSVTIDCSELTFLDSAGIRVLVLAHRRAVENGWGFSIVGLHGAALKVMQIIGLETLTANAAASDGDEIQAAGRAGSQYESGIEKPAV